MTARPHDNALRGIAVALALYVAAGVIIGLVAVAVFFTASSAAHAEEVPFVVSAEGVTLPAGQTFPDGGHVNIQASQSHTDLHFEAKCIARVDAECAGALHDAAQYIGTSFIPWSAFGLTGEFCVPWVQVAGIDKHFGDAGETPICTGGTPSTTEPSPSPSPSTPTIPTSKPEPTSSPVLPEISSPSTSPTLSSPSEHPTPASTEANAVIPSASTGAPDRLADTGTKIPAVAAVIPVALIVVGLLLLRIFRGDLETGPASDSPYTLRKNL
jgi:hypothetical protein